MMQQPARKPGLMGRPGGRGMMDESMEPTAGERNENPLQEQAEMPPEAAEALKEAVRLLYSDRFESMLKMFKANGTEGFSDSMATAVNTAIENLEKQRGQPLSPEIAAAVGMKLFFMLLEDIIKGGVLPKVSLGAIQDALRNTIQLYAEAHNVPQADLQRLMQAVAQRQPGGM